MSHVRSMNKVILVGRVGRDPEITHIPNLEKDVAKFSIATNEGYMDQNNQWKDLTEWHNIVAWGWNVKKVEKYISKGILMLVEGKLKTRKWQDKSGQERRSTEIHADNLVVLEKSEKSTSYSDNMKNQESSRSDQNSEPLSQQNQVQSPPEKDINEFPYDDSDGDPF
ncbi:MAG: single-stranded DNA-binding protein [Candidatus Aminicenantes bacterium]|nr:single-stranded DNA-binding protein [Candidatus Aminicenantes bacterium]